MTPDGRLLLSSEGQGAEVLSVPVPPRIERAMAEPTPTPAPSARPAAGADPSRRTRSPQDVVTAPTDRDAWPWLAGGVVGVLALGVLWRSLRPH